jgi:Spy/CpxP family protein refolding chaperone
MAASDHDQPGTPRHRRKKRTLMKRTFAALLIAFTSIFALQAVTWAQSSSSTQQGPPPGPPMRQGRLGGMPGGPGTFNIRVRGRMRAGPMRRFHRRGTGEWWRNPEIAEKIGLSDQQKQQLEKISLDGRLKMIDLRANLEKQHVILGPMLRAFHPNEAQVLAQIETLSQAQAALEKERVQTMLDSRSVLTEDQWNKLKNVRMEFRRGFGRRNFRNPMRPQTPAPPA